MFKSLHGKLRVALRVARFNLGLQVRNPQALAYGFAVPVLFLLSFAAVFRGEEPPLGSKLGQLLTLTILGGACFGFPTSFVAERELGIWRRYRLLPVPLSSLFAGVLLARLVLIALAGLLQLLLASALFGAPWPSQPLVLLGAGLLTSAAFLGLGLLLAALANSVPAVQALGQCLFLPMILVGGVGVPLSLLPEPVRLLACFLPGPYAVALLQAGFTAPPAPAGLGFAGFCLLVMGGAAAFLGATLFRWDPKERPKAPRSPAWVLALGVWLAVGVWAASTGASLRDLPRPLPSLDSITEAELASLSLAGLPGDQEFAGRLAPPTTAYRLRAELGTLPGRLKSWAPRRHPHPGEACRALLAVAALADLSQHPKEGLIARLVFEELGESYPPEVLGKALAWVILNPRTGTRFTSLPELGLPQSFHPDLVRDRSLLYAKKRLLLLRTQQAQAQ